MDWFSSLFFDASSTPDSTGIWHCYSGYRSSHTILLVWLHGWGQSHASFRSLVEQLDDATDHLLVDFPGFGNTPLITDTWNTEDYAKHLSPLIQSYQTRYDQIVLVGHSFGCRVSLRYIHLYPNTISGLVFIGGAGLQRKRSIAQHLRRKAIRTLLSTGKLIDKWLPTHCTNWARQRFGSRDYLAAGILRPILSRVVSEDLSPLAAQTTIPTLLIYGTHDTETPPEFGTRYHQLMHNSTLYVLPNFDHHSILTNARYHVTQHLRNWLKTLPHSSSSQG
jgi:pimeloyl-ACP methyl ester carboxylesterase